MWIITCSSGAGPENDHLQDIFRPQVSDNRHGSDGHVARRSKSKFDKVPDGLRVAIPHEGGAYGIDVGKGDADGSKTHGANLVLNEGCLITAIHSPVSARTTAACFVDRLYFGCQLFFFLS
ncbi:MAG: hypothetical protein JSR91_26370 [Proteobacteria bacterium]|nr:hypothetical protein [Pseudomonadota bacterium]